MRLLKIIAITFAQYSRIPVPRFEWAEADMKYCLSVFPWVGAVTGLLFYGVFAGGVPAALPETAVTLLLTAVPLLVTGGFHVDGFLDVEDALSSWRSREEKLRILKDPHIGAFAVIRLAIFGLIWLAALRTILALPSARQLVMIVSAGFFLSRAFSAWGVLTLKPAKDTGMLAREAAEAKQADRINRVLTALWIVLGIAGMCLVSPLPGLLTAAAALLAVLWYRYKSLKEFGGVTGDTAGYYVVLSETWMLVAAAAAGLLMK